MHDPVADPIRLLLNGTRVDVCGVSPQTTLLDWLRSARQLTGTKEGCAEGDCGACTVLVAERDDDALAWKPINACIRLLPSLHGKAVFTVESLKDRGALHPVQQAMVETHGSQCGFCTPGFVMSLFGLYKNAHRPTRRDVDAALAGNLCRCTGYRPILAAAGRMYELPAPDDWRGPGFAADGTRIRSREESRLASDLAMLGEAGTLDYEGEGQRWIAPDSEDALAAACTGHPDARLVAGATDVGLWITKEHRDLGTLIYTGAAPDLARIERTPTHIVIGAGASLEDVSSALNDDYPELAESWLRFASPPIRHAATLGGNIANGSPIGDSMPALIALGSTLVLRRGDQRREIELEDFYLDYRKTALVPGEFVASIRVPCRDDELKLRCWKISKRYDQDISAVFACFALQVRDGRVAAIRIGCGGVAPMPVRARATEAALLGRAWSEATIERASAVLAGEFTPIDDMRASAGYRSKVLGNLLKRLWFDTSAPNGVPVSVHAAEVRS